MGRPRIGIFKRMGKGDICYVRSMHDMSQVRQLSGMVLWLLVKILDRSCLMVYKGSPTKLDGIIQNKLRQAIKKSVEVEELIMWCCNAAEIKDDDQEP